MEIAHKSFKVINKYKKTSHTLNMACFVSLFSKISLLLHKILKLRRKCICFPLRTVSFRGHGFSLRRTGRASANVFGGASI